MAARGRRAPARPVADRASTQAAAGSRPAKPARLPEKENSALQRRKHPAPPPQQAPPSTAAGPSDGADARKAPPARGGRRAGRSKFLRFQRDGVDSDESDDDLDGFIKNHGDSSSESEAASRSDEETSSESAHASDGLGRQSNLHQHSRLSGCFRPAQHAVRVPCPTDEVHESDDETDSGSDEYEEEGESDEDSQVEANSEIEDSSQEADASPPPRPQQQLESPALDDLLTDDVAPARGAGGERRIGRRLMQRRQVVESPP
jgi:hypothetical protein